MATFLHSRRFLSYHGERFADASVLVEDDRGRLRGLFPAAVVPGTSSVVMSHPGITYGGLLHDGNSGGQKLLQMLEAIISHYRDVGFRMLRYKCIPHIYHQSPSQDDIYALFRLEATRYRCDLSCAVDLDGRRKPSARRQRGLRKAQSNDVVIRRGGQYAGELWRVLEDNLSRRHQAKPVHSLEEICLLEERFPENIEFVVAMATSEIVAGVVLFKSPRVVHAQYIAASQQGQDICALDAVFEQCLRDAANEGKRYFDFGISNENEGWLLNAGLFDFKSEFGGGGVIHEFYEICL